MTNQTRFHMLAVATLLALLLTACTSSKAYTFSVETGDKIRVEMDTSGGYGLSQEEGTIAVSLEKEVVLKGVFLSKEMYDQYLDAVDTSGAEILEESELGGNPCLFYEFEGKAGTEDNYIVWIDGSKTGLILSSLVGQEAAKTAFERLSFSVA